MSELGRGFARQAHASQRDSAAEANIDVEAGASRPHVIVGPPLEARGRSACFTEPGPASTGIPLKFLAIEGLTIEVEAIAMTR